MSSADLVKHKYVEEVTLGTTPAAALRLLNVVSSSIDGQIGTTVSNQISAARVETDLIRTEGSTSGDLGIEWSYGAYNDFIEGAVGADWNTAFTLTATDISAATADDSFNSVAAAWNTSTILPGYWIKVSGFANAANNGIFKVVSVTTAKIVVAANLVTEAAGPSVTVKGQSIRNGVTRKSYTIEREFSDLSNTFVSHTGMVPNTMNLAASVGSIVTGSFGFNGMSTTYATSTVGTGADLSAVSNDVFDPVDSMGDVVIDGTVFAGCVRSIDLTTTNNTRNTQCLGSLYPTSITLGTLGVTGNIEIYFNNYTMIEKFLNGTSISLSYSFSDSAGNYLVVDMPNVKFNTGTLTGISKNSDVMTSLSFTALYDATAGYAIQFSSLAA